MKILLIILFFGVVITSKAQTPSDSIFIQKNFFGYKFYQKDTRLNFNQLPYIMGGDQEAYRLVKKASSTNTIAAIISGTGGFLVGWQLVTALVGGDPNWAMAGAGVGLIVISIPISAKSYRQSLQAVNTYNSGLAANGCRPKLFLGTTSHGIGLQFKF
jgi:hypothetical protein